MKTTLKTVTTAVALTALLGGSPLLFASDDNGPDQAVKLLQDGVIKPFDQLNEVVLAKHPGAALGETELEREYGRYVYKVELRDAQGVEWDVDVDAATGEVLDDRQDD